MGELAVARTDDRVLWYGAVRFGALWCGLVIATALGEDAGFQGLRIPARALSCRSLRSCPLGPDLQRYMEAKSEEPPQRTSVILDVGMEIHGPALAYVPDDGLGQQFLLGGVDFLCHVSRANSAFLYVERVDLRPPTADAPLRDLSGAVLRRSALCLNRRRHLIETLRPSP